MTISDFMSVCPSVCPYVGTYIRMSHFHFFQFPAVVSQNVTNKSCLACVKSENYASWVTLDPSGTAAAEAKSRCVYLILKPHVQSSRPSHTALAEAKPRCVYSI